jgi:hypothetical protein
MQPRSPGVDRSAPPAPAGLSRRKTLLFAFVYFVLLAVFFLGAAEIIVRKKGYRPWIPEEISVRVDPGGKFFAKDSILGYTHIPGSFTVTLADDYAFRVTHLPNTLRITHPQDTYPAAPRKPQIWIFGCSYTYGWSLNDDETYAWMVQQAFPDHEVVNFGVNGYGQIHALLQMREALKRGPPPEIAVVTYAGFHDERNTFLRNRRKVVATWNKLGPLVQPYARLDSAGKLRYSFARAEWREFPFMRVSAFANFLELKWEGLEDRLYRSHDVTKALLREMAARAEQDHFTLVIAGISQDEPTGDILRFAEANGIPAVDISTDLAAPGYRNLPHDRHPSALANQAWARTLVAYLQTRIPR